MYVYLNDSSDTFENGADQIQIGRLLAIFVVFFGCKSDSVASFPLIVLKFGMYVYLRDSSDISKMALTRFKMAAARPFSFFFPVVSEIQSIVLI